MAAPKTTYGRRAGARALPAAPSAGIDRAAWAAIVSASAKRSSPLRHAPLAKRAHELDREDVPRGALAEDASPNAARMGPVREAATHSTPTTSRRKSARLSGAHAASPYPKSRKSEIRPRMSVSPTDAEYGALLTQCGQSEPEQFDDWLKREAGSAEICKIGESSFSEVFRIGSGDGARAVKIMPLLQPSGTEATLDAYHLPEPVHLAHLLREVRVLFALDGLRTARRYAVPSGHTGFNRLRACAVLRGPYPSELLAVWDASGEKRRPENDRPDHYGANSLHVALVMDFGGSDLEAASGLDSVPAVRSVLLQLLAAMALAEREISFEHRDLHLGNVLVRPTHRDDVVLPDGTRVPTAGLLVSVIDCSLSRYAPAGGPPVYRDLALDGWLFTGSAEVSRQYAVYREMQTATGSDWAAFHPATNVLWVAYVAEELLARGMRTLRRQEGYAQLRADVQLVSASPDCASAFSTLMSRSSAQKP